MGRRRGCVVSSLSVDVGGARLVFEEFVKIGKIISGDTERDRICSVLRFAA